MIALAQKPCGRVYLHCGRWILDAEPHVMIRARRLLVTGRRFFVRGEFTDGQHELSPTPEHAADLVWLSERYPLVFDESVAEHIRTLKTRHEAITTMASNPEALLFEPSPDALKPAYPPRPHQEQFAALAVHVKRILCADPIGGGKTESTLLATAEPAARPCLVVCQSHLVRQWKDRIERFLPDAFVDRVKNGRRSSLLVSAADQLVRAEILHREIVRRGGQP